MSTAIFQERIAEVSPRSLARVAGVCQLLEAVTATFGQVIVLGRLVVSGNASASATNILAHQQLYWWGFASSLLGAIFHIAVALLLYELLRPVNRRLSLFAAFVLLVGCAIQALTGLLYLAPLLVLTGGSSLSAFTPEQLQALSMVLLRLNGAALNTHLVFFGVWCVLMGYLIFRSHFLPRVLGGLLAIAGVGWIIYLSPPIANRIFPFIAAASALGEIPLELWLIVVGVNDQRWREQALAAAVKLTPNTQIATGGSHD